MPYKDPIKQKEAQHKHYLKNKKKFYSRMQIRRREIKKWFLEIKQKYKCSQCGIADYRVIDFHHHNEKRNGGETVSSLLDGRLRKDLVLKEIEKCIPLCSNCHRIIHWEEYQKNLGQ